MEQRLWQRYKDMGLKMIAIDPDADDYQQVSQVQDFCSTLNVTFPVGVEETSNYELFTQAHEGVNPYPVDIIVDKTGVIRYVSREYDPAAMEAVVQELMAE